MVARGDDVTAKVKGEATMGLSRFIAYYLDAPSATRQHLGGFMLKMGAVKDWVVCPDGQVMLMYDSHRICGETIEEVLVRHGFEVKHILDEPYVDETAIQEAFAGEPGCG